MKKKAAGQKKNYKHYSMLRKAIVLKRSGVIRFCTTNNDRGELFVYQGEIDCSNRYEQLIKFLCNATVMTEWHEGGLRVDTMPAVRAMCYTLNNVVWSESELHAVSVMFSKLPRVHVTLLDIHFDNFLTDISYNLFYQQSLSIEGFMPAYFLLNNDSSDSLLLHRVRILTFNYVLGLMNAAKEEDTVFTDTAIRKNKKFGFIGRIIQRIRELR